MAYRIYYANNGGRMAGLWRTLEGAKAEVQHLQAMQLEEPALRYERAGESQRTIDTAARTWSVDQYEIREVEETPEILEELAGLALYGILN